MHTAPPTPPPQSPLLTMNLARRAADRVVFSTTIAPLHFLRKDDLGSAAGNEMVLNFYEGLVDKFGCVGTGVTCACD